MKRPVQALGMLWLWAVAFTSTAAAELFLEGGAYLPNPGYVAQDSNGNKSLLSPLYAVVGPRASVPLGSDTRFEPSVRVVLPWRRNIDGDQKYYTSLFNLDLGVFMSPSWELRGGVGFQWTVITGSGGAVTQKNGTSSATFYTPSYTESLWIGSVDLGTSYSLASSLRITFDAAIWEVASASRRKLSLLVGLDYAIF